MPMTIYKLFADAAGESVASIDIQLDGVIRSIHMTLAIFGVNGADEGGYAEVSFLSSETFTVNDARGSLMIIQTITGQVGATGQSQASVNASISSLDVPVSAGERVHMHLADAGAIVGRNCHAYLFVEDKGVARIPGRRR